MRVRLLLSALVLGLVTGAGCRAQEREVDVGAAPSASPVVAPVVVEEDADAGADVAQDASTGGRDETRAPAPSASPGRPREAPRFPPVAAVGTSVRYPPGARHSPMSAGVVRRLAEVLAGSRGRRDVFAKVGDSITVSGAFLSCFARPDVVLGAHGHLAPTMDYFRRTLADGVASSFERSTLAAAVGWSSARPIEGSPSPLEREIAATRPGFAVVMLGTNETYAQGIYPFARNLLATVDALLGLGVVPVLSTIPPRRDRGEARALVPEMNAVVRAIAEERQVPLVDYWQTLTGLPSSGLMPDGVHPRSLVSAIARPCWLDAEGLSHGMNQRNLVTLEALDRARRFLVDHAPPEPDPPPLSGMGTLGEPFLVDALPFVHHGDTRSQGSSDVDRYACSPADTSGREVVYAVTASAPTRLSIRAFSGAGVDVDLHWMTAKDGATCVARDDRGLVVDAAKGTHYLAVDTVVRGGVARAGDYRLTIVPVE